MEESQKLIQMALLLNNKKNFLFNAIYFINFNYLNI